MESINRKLSISEMAQIHDISRQTLIYYDKIGLFQPEYVDEETGYRYYNTLQIPRLREICFLRSIGMPLDEIRLHNQYNNSLDTIELLEAQNEKIKKNIETLKVQQAAIEKRVRIYQNAKGYAEDAYKPYIEHYPERKVMHYAWREDHYDRQELHFALMKLWNQTEKLGYLPSRRWGAIIFKDSLLEGRPLYRAGGCCLMTGKPQIPEAESANIVTLVDADYVCMPKFGMPYDMQHIYKLMEWIENNDYEIIGDIYDECLLDAIFYGDDQELDFCEIQIPIRKKSLVQDN